jgi:hypothetical protein
LISSLITTRVWQQLSQVAREANHPAHVAVAYFGSGASQLLPLPAASLLVVDASASAVRSGQTCPTDLLSLHCRGVRIHSFCNLHAKVYAFNDVAFIGSANVSRHSESVLLEAMLLTRRKAEVYAARSFVKSLCAVELNADDLARLAKLYRPRKFAGMAPGKAPAETLIMELTHEQGPGRETQVQPPKGVWAHYFGLNSAGSAPSQVFTLTNGRDQGAAPERRPIVSHHHVWTLEIAGAGLPRPAIIKLKRLTNKAYLYYVYRKADHEYALFDKLLAETKNLNHHSGRRWIVI